MLCPMLFMTWLYSWFLNLNITYFLCVHVLWTSSKSSFSGIISSILISVITKCEKITIRNLSSTRCIFESTELQMRAHRKGWSKHPMTSLLLQTVNCLNIMGLSWAAWIFLHHLFFTTKMTSSVAEVQIREKQLELKSAS